MSLAATSGIDLNKSGQGQEEIWSSILDSVASSKATPTKNVFLLGEPNVGKTTFLNFLKHGSRIRDKPLNEEGDKNILSYEELPATSSEEDFFKSMDKPVSKAKLALSHSYVDLKDEDGEDSMARLNLYQISEHDPSLHRLMNMGLNYHSYKHSAAIIFLDWSRPWEFLSQLIKWFKVLELTFASVLDHGSDTRTLDDPDSWTQGKALIEELSELLSISLREYKDPSFNNGVEATGSSIEINNDIGLSLPSLHNGTLIRNLALPIIIVCNKSDKIKAMERDAGYKEEHFDFIQQALRSICLAYGASLVYTSIMRPSSFSLLRNYLLHRLFTTPSHLPSSGDTLAPAPVPASSVLPSYLNQFKARGRVMERERVFVPSGWDTFPKIRVLRDSFDCDSAQLGFELDLGEELQLYLPARHSRRIKSKENLIEDEITSLKEVYSSIVPLPFAAARANLPSQAVSAEPEQQFLAAHYSMFQGIDSANFFNSQLPYVGTVGLVEKSNRVGTSEPKIENPGNDSTAGNSFFKMLAMKDSANA